MTANELSSRPVGTRLLHRRLSQRMNELGLLVAIAVVFLLFSLNAPGFASGGNQLGILRDAAEVGIPAWGMTLVIIAGEIDISIGPAVAFSGVMLAKMSHQWGVPLVPSILLTLLLGTSLGAVAGWLRARFNVPSFITTLGLYEALRGLAEYLTNALPVSLPQSSILDVLGGNTFGVPTDAIIMLIGLAVFAFVARRTAYGRSVFAIGGNANAASLAGISLTRSRIALFATTGFLSAVTGVIEAARLGSGNGGTAEGLEFQVIAAVVIGGTALAGGVGSMLGTALGVYFITLIVDGLVLMGINSFVQDVVQGVVIVLAVLVNVTVRGTDRSSPRRIAALRWLPRASTIKSEPAREVKVG